MWFTKVVKEYRSDRELLNSINYYEWLGEESLVEKLGKKRLGIIGPSWWQTLHKPNPKPRTLCWTYFLKTSFSLAYHISFRSNWVCFSSNHAYFHGWLLLKSLKLETLLSQGLLDYFHVSQSSSKFTCSNIKTSSFDPSLNICDESITTIKLHLSIHQLLFVIDYKNGEIDLHKIRARGLVWLGLGH